MKPTKRTITALLFGIPLSLGAAGLVNAAASTDSSTVTTAATPTDDTATTDPTETVDDASGGPHTANGITETELTGDEATSVEAAVLAEYPDATIERMETDAEGAAFEAHITLADGSHSTVKLDASFAITATEEGHGGGRHGGHGGGPLEAGGVTEEELTGDTAASVEAAVLAANPGATIERLETDAEGAAYEAHVTLADGSEATIKLDSAFAITATETDD